MEVETNEESWIPCEPVIPLERVQPPPSTCVTPESDRSRNQNGSPDSNDESGRKTLSKSDRKAKEAERRIREEERKRRLEAKEEEKRKKEEERKKREEEKRKKEEEKEEEKRKKEEERKKREEEKRKKEEEKEAERLKKEEERKKREEEKEEEKKRKEEERRKKEEERKKKEEEKEEERRKKEEEKKKKEEERLKALEEKRKQAEAEERKKARVSQSFLNFFKRASLGPEEAPKKLKSDQESSTTNSLFKPFQLKPHQTLAEYVPSVIKKRFDPDVFEQLVSSQNLSSTELYIKQLKSGSTTPFRLTISEKEEVKREDKEASSDLIIEEPAPTNKYKAKFFDLSDIRPPYYGTWRKKSKIVTGRKPWARDTQFLDYDVDSEDEWDGEEEDGESIASSGSDSSRKADDDFEMDDFLVPHGHLSDDEEACEEEEGEIDDAPKKHVTLVKLEDLYKANDRKVSKLTAQLIGPYWQTKDNTDQDAFKLLEPYKCVFNF